MHFLPHDSARSAYNAVRRCRSSHDDKRGRRAIGSEVYAIIFNISEATAAYTCKLQLKNDVK